VKRPRTKALVKIGIYANQKPYKTPVVLVLIKSLALERL